jgi:mannose-6-phosphate isomerase-like protein (cupin superfamily)
MRSSKIPKPWLTLSTAISAACVMLATAADTTSDPVTDRTPLAAVTFSFDEAKFGEPITNFSHDGLRIAAAPVWSDPETSRMSTLLRWSKGTDFRHKHTFSYQVVILKGEMTHWTESLPGSELKRLSVGSSWYTPAGEAHVDKCVTDQCITITTAFGPGTTIIVGDGK